ncbi:AMP-dependent synthetase, partial [Streptomonospora algeriensis]
RGGFESDGALRVIDRLKRVVRRGGYSISPREAERHAAAHPALAEAVCVGVPDAESGERLCVCVVQREGREPLSLPELNAFLEQGSGLERAKLPGVLLRLAALPLGATGKVCHPALSEWGAAGGERVCGAEGASAPGEVRGAVAPEHSRLGETWRRKRRQRSARDRRGIRRPAGGPTPSTMTATTPVSSTAAWPRPMTR